MLLNLQKQRDKIAGHLIKLAICACAQLVKWKMTVSPAFAKDRSTRRDRRTPARLPEAGAVPQSMGRPVSVQQHTQWPNGVRAKCPRELVLCGRPYRPLPVTPREDDTQLDELGGAHSMKSTDPELIAVTK